MVPSRASLSTIAWRRAGTGFATPGGMSITQAVVSYSGIVAGTLVVIAVAGLLLWHQLTRHEASLRAAWARFLEHPKVAALRERYARELAFLQARLSPEGYLGLHLTVGLMVIIFGTWLFSGIADQVVENDPIVQVDLALSRWLHAQANPPFTQAMLLASYAGYELVILLSVALGVLWLARRRWYELSLLVLAVGGGGLLNLLLKGFFGRERPTFDEPLGIFSGNSFPSGHTMSAALFYGLVAYLAARAARTWRLRLLVVGAAAAMILLVGFSRIYLGAHFLSDVLGAYAAALAWLACTITGAETLQRRRLYRRTKAPRSQCVSPVPTSDD